MDYVPTIAQTSTTIADAAIIAVITPADVILATILADVILAAAIHATTRADARDPTSVAVGTAVPTQCD